jgi:hypothetical protein
MRYGLKLIHELCQELGFRSSIRSTELLEIDVNDAGVLCFKNAKIEEDCLVGFDGTPWHTHDDFVFADRLGNHVVMNYLDVVSGLENGAVLICERWHKDQLLDRWMIHSNLNDELRFMDKGEEIRIRRPAISLIREQSGD